jgi:tetratricopeptide (TPR) repeat protein
VEYTDDDSIFGKTSEEELKQGDKVFNGMLMAFLTAGYIGVVFVVYILPVLAHKFSHAVYDSGEMVEKDVMHDARALYAQGDYEGAIEAYRAAAKADPNNRMPWVEIAKIQRENLEDPDAAIETLRHVLEHYAWPERDAAFFLFRLAEIYDHDKEDRASAAAILQQVMEQFPETRHSANARHKLHDWGVV